jgi:hypothetical protein
MRFFLCFLVLGTAAAAQPAQEFNQRLRDAANRSDTLVLSIYDEGDGRFVYDLPGETDTRAIVFNTGAFIVRAPDVGRALVIVEPFGGESSSVATDLPQIHTGLLGPNTALLTPHAPIAEFRLRYTRLSEYLGGPDAPPIETYHRVRVLACADGQGEDCQTWTAAEPRSGRGDLYLIVVDAP